MPNFEEELPTVQKFCVSLPLYHETPGLPVHASGLDNYLYKECRLDCLCVDCTKESTFISPAIREAEIHSVNWTDDRVFTREFICSRDSEHKIYFVFRMKGSRLMKIGQSPSVADLANAEIRQYRKVLGESKFKEFSKAVGLVSHGVGIGSFVYLRRIFEHLINEAYKKAKEDSYWKSKNDEKYQENLVRVGERIELLRDFLPVFLVEQRRMYSILSKGVHELDEETCLMYFPVVKKGIELILDQHEAKRKQKEKEAEAAKALGDIHKNLNTKSDSGTKS